MARKNFQTAFCCGLAANAHAFDGYIGAGLARYFHCLYGGRFAGVGLSDKPERGAMTDRQRHHRAARSAQYGTASCWGAFFQRLAQHLRS